jgi:hypothetical protein
LKGSTGLRSPERKLATNDLKLAGAALTGRQATTKKSAAVASPLARLQSAAGYVNAAGAIDVGTAVQVSDRTVAAVPLALGQDLDIAGGAGPSKSVPAVAVARQDAVSAVLKHAGGGGGGSLQQQLVDYNQAQLTSYQRLTGYELLARVTLARLPAVSLRLPRLTWARGCK